MGRQKVIGILRQCIGLNKKDVRTLSATSASITHPEDPELQNAKPFSDVPGIKGFWNSFRLMLHFFPLIGKYASSPLRLGDIHTQRFYQYGKIHRYDMITGRKLVFVYDANDIQKVFRHEGRHPDRRMLDSIKKYRYSRPHMYKSAGILIETGEKWYQTRSKVQVPMMRPQIVETYIPQMEAVSTDFVERMKTIRDETGEIPNYVNELYKWALESIGLVAFNARLGCLAPNLKPDSEAQRMITAVNISFDSSTHLEFGLPFWRLFPSKKYNTLVDSQDYIHGVANKYIQQTVLRVRTNHHNGEDDSKDGGILKVLLQREDLDRRELFTFILDLLQAGVDTTSHSVGFTLYLLARNPDKQEKLFEELSKVLPTSKTAITPELLNKLPYMKSCVKESMRLMSVADFTSRIMDHDISLSGYRIPAGVYIMVMMQIAARLPEYFDEPKKFLPERWLDKSLKTHPYSNLPFGHGPRTCIGRRVALQEIYLLLIKIFQNFRVEYHYEDIRLKTRFVNMPDKPLRFTFVNRH